MGKGGRGKKRKEGHFSPSALSLFRFHLSFFPPETPDTQADFLEMAYEAVPLDGVAFSRLD